MITENGWPSCDVSQCDTNPIPGTNSRIPLQRGIPNIILKAFAGVLNEYVESANNGSGYADEGGYTPTNSVGTSNHLGGTAFDYNWNDHPMGPQVPDEAAGWQGSEITDWQPEEPRVRELLLYFTVDPKTGKNNYAGDDAIQLIWWGNDWDNPHDSMHFQMGYNTYQNQKICNDYINRYINPDGTSKFMQDKLNQPTPPTPPVEVGFDRDGAINALYLAVEDFDEDDAAKYIDAIVSGLAQSQCNTVERIAMWLAQIGHESGDFVYTEEIGKGAGKSYAPFCGRTWIQITWQSNYAKFGQWCADKGLISDPNKFVNDPGSLADLQWAGIGAAWYWMTQRPINALIDAGDSATFTTDVGSYSGAMDCVTAAINGGLTNIDDRRARYSHALAVGNDLLKLIPTATDNGDPDVPDQTQLDRIEAKLDEVLNQLNGQWPQNGNDMQAALDLDKRKAAGDKLTLNDLLVWLKNHASTHKAPTP